jgi:3-deoxy-D-manno-octulosonic-acid transferase
VRIGNLKFDQTPFMLPAHLIGLGLAPHEDLFVAGSTHPQEEEAVLACYRQLLDITPGLVLLVAPRHIERAQALESTIRAGGFAVVRKTTLDRQLGTVKGPRVILLDTRGQLAALYSQAALVFVGGSLVPIGGHSPLEPASVGKAVVFGPYMDHFAEVSELLVSQGGAIQVHDSQEMAAALGGLLKDRARLTQMGRAAEVVVRSHQGTVAKTTELIAELLKRVPRSR